MQQQKLTEGSASTTAQSEQIPQNMITICTSLFLLWISAPILAGLTGFIGS